ncbi:MAG: TraB/GumN family protein [Candidatus Thermoplasmatota archaeon]
MITIIGVGHVFAIEKRIEEEIMNRKPNLVCVELDATRYEALVSNEKGSDIPIIYRLLALFQQKIAEKYGAKVGGEMLSAVETARKINAEVAFIDMDASAVLKKLLESMSLVEKIKFIFASFFSLFVKEEKVEKEIKRFEEDEEGYIREFGEQFPTVMNILVDERDEYMSSRLIELSKKYENIVAVIGDGHVGGVSKRLPNLDLEIVRLKEIRT